MVEKNAFKLIYNQNKKYISVLINNKYAVPIRTDDAFKSLWEMSDVNERRVMAQKLCNHAINTLYLPHAKRNEVLINYS